MVRRNSKPSAGWCRHCISKMDISLHQRHKISHIIFKQESSCLANRIKKSLAKMMGFSAQSRFSVMIKTFHLTHLSNRITPVHHHRILGRYSFKREWPVQFYKWDIENTSTNRTAAYRSVFSHCNDVTECYCDIMVHYEFDAAIILEQVACLNKTK